MTLQEIKNGSTYAARKAVLMQIARANYNGDYDNLDYKSWDGFIQTYFHSTAFIERVEGFEIYKHTAQILSPAETIHGQAVSVEIWEATKSIYDETGEPVKVEEYYTAYAAE